MLHRLQAVETRFEELTSELSDPLIHSNRELFLKKSREHADLTTIVERFREWKKISSDLEENEAIIDANDVELKALALEELPFLRGEKERLSKELMILLIPKNPNDDKNVILEIRAGTGGEEAALFVGNLLTMYTRYSEGKGWKIDLMNLSYADMGGYKEVIAKIDGHGAYSFLKYESGVHRVQRVPATETQGRIHTSTVTVAVLPEAEEIELEIFDKDLRIDVFRAGGPGGQSVNTTDSAVRVTHIPSGIVVICQDEKSQHKNKAKALTVLRARLFASMQAEADAERSSDRKSQIGTGERSEKIRTYNYPQSRVTDHRIGLTVYQLDTVLAGKVELLLEPIIAHDRAEALKQSS
jgi:peptide chain release factor 1